MQNEDITNKAIILLDKIERKLESEQINNSNILHEQIQQSLNQHFNNKLFDNNVFDCNIEKNNDIDNRSNTNNNINRNNNLRINDLKKLIQNEQLLQLHHNYQKILEQNIISGIAIIQAFYGTDISRILATTKALQLMLQSNPIAEDFIFIEAQTNKNRAVFSWLKNYKVKYIFKKINKDNEGLFLKTALWNIGVEETKAERLCFIDSDIVFCNQNWLESVNCAFDRYDVLSLAGYCYYENNKKYNNISTSIGHNVMISNETDFSGHIGFNIGMTRKSYDMYGKFEAFNMHDDIWIWHQIFGSNLKPEVEGFTPYKMTENMKYGLPFKVGSTEEIACHIAHENRIDKYKLYGFVSYLGTSYPFEDIEYDRNQINILPKWANSKTGQCIKLAFKMIEKLEIYRQNCKQQAEEILLETKKKVYGEIDDQHPLIIMTAFVPDFKHKTFESVFEHKECLKRYCQQQFTYVCFTDEITTEEASERGLDVIPFSSKKVKNDRSLWKNEMKRKNIKLPKNAVVVWIDIDSNLNKELNFTRNDYT